MNGKKSGCVSLYNPDGMVYDVCECDNGVGEENGDVVYRSMVSVMECVVHSTMDVCRVDWLVVDGIEWMIGFHL